MQNLFAIYLCSSYNNNFLILVEKLWKILKMGVENCYLLIYYKSDNDSLFR